MREALEEVVEDLVDLQLEQVHLGLREELEEVVEDLVDQQPEQGH